MNEFEHVWGGWGEAMGPQVTVTEQWHHGQ